MAHIIQADLNRPRQGSYSRANINAYQISDRSTYMSGRTTCHKLNDPKPGVGRVQQLSDMFLVYRICSLDVGWRQLTCESKGQHVGLLVLHPSLWLGQMLVYVLDGADYHHRSETPGSLASTQEPEETWFMHVREEPKICVISIITRVKDRLEYRDEQCIDLKY